MTLIEWATLAGLCLLGAASPGPSLAVVVSQTLQGGRNHGIKTALAHGAGVGCYALIAALGLAVVVQQTPGLLRGLQWLGAGFLLYLAYLSATTRAAKFEEGSTPKPTQGVAAGFLTAFLNPKLALFFLAVYTQFITPTSGLAQKLGMAGVSAGVDAAWYAVVAALVSHPVVMARLEKNALTIDRFFALLLILVAVRVVSG